LSEGRIVQNCVTNCKLSESKARLTGGRGNQRLALKDYGYGGLATANSNSSVRKKSEEENPAALD
jgi:hypothetical protein